MVFFNKKTIFLTLLFGFISVFATDYKAMSMDELMSLRGMVPVQDIEVYGAELTKRVETMSDDEIKKYNVSQQISGVHEKQTGHVCNALKQRHKR